MFAKVKRVLARLPLSLLLVLWALCAASFFLAGVLAKILVVLPFGAGLEYGEAFMDTVMASVKKTKQPPSGK